MSGRYATAPDVYISQTMAAANAIEKPTTQSTEQYKTTYLYLFTVAFECPQNNFFLPILQTSDHLTISWNSPHACKMSMQQIHLNVTILN